MKLTKKFETASARVKGVCFHPTKPWIITSLHSGAIQIWDYNMEIKIASWNENQGPVRGVHFHPHLPLFVSGADVGDVRVWNYKQKRCMFVLKGHIDYIRTVFFHHELPWILSASDDNTMRIWNYQSRNCVNLITGHLHYVMCAKFHPQKNLIVSASLDSSVRIWDYSILKRKLAEAKYSTGYIGIEIECIKILQGHERGCNWATFQPQSNIIASGSDDKKIKLWKYTNEVAWQHGTIMAHKNNVSCLIFDPISQNLITNSQDRTLKIWNIQTKSQIVIQKKQRGRYWILDVSNDGTNVASGHDQGLDIFELNPDKTPFFVASNNFIIYSYGLQHYSYNLTKKTSTTHTLLCKPKDKNSICYYSRLWINPFNESFCCFEVYESIQLQKFYLLYKITSITTNVNITLYKQINALDCCFINQHQIATISSSLNKIDIYQLSLTKNDKKTISFIQPFQIKKIFSSNKSNQIIIITSHNNKIFKYNIDNNCVVAQIGVDQVDVHDVVFGINRIAIVLAKNIIITDQNLYKIITVRQKSAIKSVYWQSQQILFYTNISHLKCVFMTGQTQLICSISEPITIIKQLDDKKFLAFGSRSKVLQLEFPQYHQLKQFKIALSNRKLDKIKSMLESNVIKENKKIFLKYLVEAGLSELTLHLLNDPEEQFSLAIQSSNFQLAYELCNKINTQQYWKMLGQQALKQGIYEAYELSCQKLKNFDQLNFLYSLQNNLQKLQKVSKIAKKTVNPILAFNTNLYLNNGQTYEQLLRESGLQNLAQLVHESYTKQIKKNQLLVRLKSKIITPCQPVGDKNFNNWPHNVEDDDDN